MFLTLELDITIDIGECLAHSNKKYKTIIDVRVCVFYGKKFNLQNVTGIFCCITCMHTGMDVKDTVL